jgi:hypothetical protein
LDARRRQHDRDALGAPGPLDADAGAGRPLVKTCEYDGEPFREPRSHPWSGSALDPSARYYDLAAAPELIRTVLEDFEPFRAHAAIDDFYSLLERLNHPESALESSDCAFSGPQPNRSRHMPGALECSGRLMILFRALEQNTLEARMAWLRGSVQRGLATLDPLFSAGIIGTTLVPSRYLALPSGAQLGQQLMLSFWAYGNSEASVMQALSRLFRNLSRALRSVSAHVAVSANA